MSVGSILSRWWEGTLCVQISCFNTLFSMGTPNQPGWSSPWQYSPGRRRICRALAAPIPELGSLDDLDPRVQTVTR